MTLLLLYILLRQPATERREVCPGAEWFHSTAIAPPSWTAGLEVACVIDGHVFYRRRA